MNPKNFSKKLTLNKKTVAHLNDAATKNARGGRPVCKYMTWGAASCDTICYTEWSGEDETYCAEWAC